MAVFKFKFTAVLKQKQIREDSCQRDLAKLMRRRMIYQDQLRQIQTTITESKSSLSDTLVGQIDMSRVGDFARYSGQTTTRAHQIVRGLADLERAINDSRAVLQGAMRERKAIELLEEKQKAQWKADIEKREAADLDEIGIQNYMRRQSSAEVN